MAQLMGMASVLQNIRFEPVTVILPSPPSLTGPLAPNTWLTRTRSLAAGQLPGPYSLAFANGNIYTGLKDGWVVEISPQGNVRKVLRMSMPNCGQMDAGEDACGRPLGIRADKDGKLYVADVYSGIFWIDPTPGADPVFKHLVDAKNLQINGKPLGFINDLTLAKDGTIFFTSSSTRWSRNNYIKIYLEGQTSGRVLAYNPVDLSVDSGVKELITGLSFPTGIQLSPDENFLYIVESARCRIHRVHIGTTGEIEIFAENLPGFANNLRFNPRGNLWVGISWTRTDTLPTPLDKYGSQPELRRRLMEQSPGDILSLIPRYGMAVELDMNGTIVKSLQDPRGSIFGVVTEVDESSDGILYIASPEKNFIALLHTSDLTKDTNMVAYSNLNANINSNANSVPRANTYPNQPTFVLRSSTATSPNMNVPSLASNLAQSNQLVSLSTSNTSIVSAESMNDSAVQQVLAIARNRLSLMPERQIRLVTEQLVENLLQSKLEARQAQIEVEQARQRLLAMQQSLGMPTDLEIQLVKQSWRRFYQDGKVPREATFLFVRFFELAPNTSSLFTFLKGYDLQELLTNTRMQNLVNKMAAFLNVVITNLQNIPTASKIIRDQGEVHRAFSVKVEHIQPILDGIFFALNMKLGPDGFNDTERAAWKKVLHLIYDNFKAGLEGASASSTVARPSSIPTSASSIVARPSSIPTSASSIVARPSSIPTSTDNTAQGSTVRSNQSQISTPRTTQAPTSVIPEPVISSDQLALIKKSWDDFTTGDFVKIDATYIYVDFFQRVPQAASLFSYVGNKTSEAELLTNTQLQALVTKVLEALTNMVGLIPNYDSVVSAVHSLGQRHKAYGVQPSYLQPMKESILFALDRKLGPVGKFDQATSQAWTVLLDYIIALFLEGLNRT